MLGLHPYLREKLRDLRNHGYCIIENQLIMDDESIWGGHSHDLFDEQVAKHFGGKPFLMKTQANGDLLIKEPETQAEMAEAICEARTIANQTIDEGAFADDGLIGVRRGLVQ